MKIVFEYLLIFIIAEATLWIAVLLYEASQAEGYICFLITFLGLLILKRLYEDEW